MKKKTKLLEKGIRMPDFRKIQWDEEISKYLKEMETLNSESARSHRFSTLLQALLGILPDFIDNYVSGIEKYIKIKNKDRILKGKADNLFGNIIIEIERNIISKKDEAEEQLKKYCAILWSQEAKENRTPYLCIATDCVKFLSYTPVIKNPDIIEINPDDISLQLLEDADWKKFNEDEIFYWLDRYFLRQEILKPTSEFIVKDFGVSSHAFKICSKILFDLWKQIKVKSSYAVIYENWEKYLSIVYGGSVVEDELFIKHTYLATLAKIMAWMRIKENMTIKSEEDIIDLLEGEVFKKFGLENFIEEDFFSWIAREDAKTIGVNIVRWLYSLIKQYNLRELSEDVLKSLYQELVDPATRHDLGEYYTPDWLAHRIVKKLLDEKPDGLMFDPACGSGTFLYVAIREKRERFGNSSKTLKHILNSIYGADIHPLAVIISKTNYILALGDLIQKRKKEIYLPIYLSDTIKIPVRWATISNSTPASLSKSDYEVRINGRSIYLPENLLKEPILYDIAIELCKTFALQIKSDRININMFKNFLIVRNFPHAQNDMILKALYSTTEVLKYLIDKERDTIWAFILKNIYKPLFFKQKFDFIIGNPPWISFRYIESEYQKFLKNQIKEKYKLIVSHGELITHLEVATFFFVRSSDLYLKPNGTIAFVLPKSVFNADQHHIFRNNKFLFVDDYKQQLIFKELWDCEGVKPLFKVPSCVLIAQKKEKQVSENIIKGEIIKGTLNNKNTSLQEAEKIINIEKCNFFLSCYGKRSYWYPEKGLSSTISSFYKSFFYQGATIVPRSFWFIDIEQSDFGFNPELPLLKTSEYAKNKSKDAYKDVFLRGNIENNFIYTTLISTDLLPFGHLNYRLIILPIEPKRKQYIIIDKQYAEKKGFFNIANWLSKAEDEWMKIRGLKFKSLNIYNRLDYNRGITRQSTEIKYKVI